MFRSVLFNCLFIFFFFVLSLFSSCPLGLVFSFLTLVDLVYVCVIAFSSMGFFCGTYDYTLRM